MSFKIKKQKELKTTLGNLSIEFLHEERMSYFEKNKDNINIQQEMNEYFLNTCDILAKYYETKDDIKKINPYEEIQLSTEQYELEKKYYDICNIPHIQHRVREKKDECCGQELILSEEYFFTCNACGRVGDVLINNSTFKQIQETNVTNKFVYKRINYFNDWLKQIQGNEVSDVPIEILNQIRVEIKKRNIRDINKIKPYMMKKILKELHYPKYYENINLIISKLTNKPNLVIPNEIAEKMKRMFHAIQEPYEKLKGDRTNFFSYPYILYKFCELLDMKEYLQYIQLLKSREKILNHDVLWKKIIINMQSKEGDNFWKFIPSC